MPPAPLLLDDLDALPPGAAASLSGGRRGVHRLGDFEPNRRFASLAERASIYRSMLRTSPTVGGGAFVILGQLKRPTPYIERQPHQSEAAADAIRWWMGLGDDAPEAAPMGMPWVDMVGAMGSALWYGHVAIAIGLRLDADTGLICPYFVRRQQRTYWNYHLDPATDRLIALELTGDVHGRIGSRIMRRYDDAGRLRFMWLALDGGDHAGAGEGGLDGTSLLRYVWAEARDGGDARQLRRAAMIRHAVGMYHVQFDTQRYLLARFGSQAQALTDEQRYAAIKEERDAIDADLASMDTSAQPRLVTADWVTAVTLLGNGKAFDPTALTGVANAADRSAGEALWIATIQQGRSESGGARSMVEAQAELMPMALHGLHRWLLGEFRAQALALFLNLNFPGMPPRETPTLDAPSLVAPPWLGNPSAFVQAAVQAGLMNWTPADEQEYRAGVGFRTLDEAEVTAAEERRATERAAAIASTTTTTPGRRTTLRQRAQESA